MTRKVIKLKMKYAKLQEEELKNKVASEFFGNFDCTEVIDKIGFAVKSTSKTLTDSYFLWAEAKAAQTDVCEMLTQLILTIGKARTFDKITPPPFLGCFDQKKIAFVPYHAVQEIFYQNDFNWKVTPSNRNTWEFKQVFTLIKNIIDNPTEPDSVGVFSHTETLIYREESTFRASVSPSETHLSDFQRNENDLKQFIRTNFILGQSDTTKIRVDKNNFTHVYHRWLEMVKPTIAVNWELAKKAGIVDGDFYLADLLSRGNETLKEKLFMVFQSSHYVLDGKIYPMGFFKNKQTCFTDCQRAHLQFWAIYERPPLEGYWDYLIERRNLLVPQDVRERNGSFFTPRIWVELSQRYIADGLGEHWQDEYYVWDCAAGTGNLLTGLTNKYNIWASTIDKADVDVMHDRIDNGANLLKDHVFQFDFLNDNFSKLPEGLQDVINDEDKRKKLIIYINPPYAEAGVTKQRTGTGKNKEKVATDHRINKLYGSLMGNASNEISSLFFMRVVKEISGSILATFSKLKYGTQNFKKFRDHFLAQFKKGFLVPADSFDNVQGQFPIGFFIWDTSKERKIRKFTVDVYEKQGVKEGKKRVHIFNKVKPLTLFTKKGVSGNGTKDEVPIGHFAARGCDFQNQSAVFIDNLQKERKSGGLHVTVSNMNLILVAISFAVRKVIPADWLNDRDQFLYPNDGWKTDREFRNDCLAYTLFHGSNNIQSHSSVNHWIPFTEKEVCARNRFESHFMTDFIAGKIEHTNGDLFSNEYKTKKLMFSADAKEVFKEGRKLWTYYHAQPKCNVNASLYDIREHFQGRNANGKMNNKSTNETYNALIADLRSALNTLAKKIESKVYEYGFLKE